MRTQNTPPQPYALSDPPRAYEVHDKAATDTNSEVSEEYESMFVPFQMFASQTPNVIVLDSDSESESASKVEELPLRTQSQPLDVARTSMGSRPPTRIYIDLDELDD